MSIRRTTTPRRTNLPGRSHRGRLGLLALAVVTSPVLGQASGKPVRGPRHVVREITPIDHRFTPRAVTVDGVPTLRVTTTEFTPVIGESFASGGIAGTACGASTHANPEIFNGGSLYIQRGFAEGEVAWVVFDVAPGSFPITIERMEFVVAQDATEQTLTDWSLLVMDGPPDEGIMMYQFESAGALLPVIVLSPGLNALNIQIDVDPSDPEPLIIANDSGFGSVSVGFRIDAHNNPPANDCDPPPESSNAFPTTDADGVASLTGNWLEAITCPLSPCNGTNSFANLGVCRPSGDWLIRVTFTCTSIGACCNLSEGCVDDVSDVDCGAQGGTFMGADTLCAGLTCPPPEGACCTRDACLADVSQPLCEALTDGVFMGNLTTCNSVDCNRGACCMPDATCFDVIDAECDRLGGNFRGGGTDCATYECPQPTGSCCIEGFCFANQPRDVCESLGTFNGIGSTCSPDPCVGCPVATILTASPPSGTIDARQPHEPHAPLVRQGIGSPAEPIVVALGEAGAETCFTLCETAADPQNGANDIAAVTDLGGGVYEIVLQHAIAPGAVTTLRYEGDGSYVSYVLHPGNVNGDGFADAADLGTMIDGLSGTGPLPDPLAGDADHSGAVGPADILRMLDLLNGADAYEVWLDTPVPVNGSCP